MARFVSLSPPHGPARLTWQGRTSPHQLPVPAAAPVERFGPHPASLADGGVLLHGDNRAALALMLDHGLRGRVNLVYVDPPFGSGAAYARRVRLRGPGAAALGTRVEYHDTLDDDSYLQFIFERLIALRDLLADDGSIFLHCDFRKAHLLRCLMDEVFGAERCQNEIVWFYPRGGDGQRQFNRKHDTILFYSRGERWTFNYDEVVIPYSERQLRRFNHQDERGRFYWNVNPRGERVKTYLHKHGIGAYDVWTIPIAAGLAYDLGYPTLKPPALLERIVRAASRPGDLVLDCFCGSGAAPVAAQALGRRWLACDVSRGAVRTTARRLRWAIAAQPPPAGQHPGFEVWQVGELPPATPTPRLAVRAHRTADRLVVEVEDYVNPELVRRLGRAPDDWRCCVDEVVIDLAYDGQMLRVALADAPARRAELPAGRYELPASSGPAIVAVRTVDVLGDEALATVAV